MSTHSSERTTQRIRLTIIVVVLITLALTSFWLLQTMQKDSNGAPAAHTRNKPDYYVEKFNYVKMSETGQPRYDITGDKMLHFPQDDSFEVTQPVATSLDPKKASMTLRAERAHIEDNNSKVHLIDNVRVERAAFGTREAMQLQTQYLLLLPDEDLAKTNQPVEITLGQSVMTGTGMVINNATQQLQLHHDVRGTYQPRPR